jgi:hypothetical protein
MPLYLVRWPNLSCSLIKARSKDDALYIIDELGNITGVQITRYTGPVFFDFTLPTDKPYPIKEEVDRFPLTDADIEIGDVSRIAAGEFPVTIPTGADTAVEMRDAIIAGAFPHLYRALQEDEVSIEAVEAAIRKEALVAVKATWREAGLWAHGTEDEQLAALMGMPVKDVSAFRKSLRDYDSES